MTGKTTPDRETWLTTNEAANYLNKSAGWITANASRLGIPRAKLGKHYRYPLSRLNAWLDAQLVSAS